METSSGRVVAVALDPADATETFRGRDALASLVSVSLGANTRTSLDQKYVHSLVRTADEQTNERADDRPPGVLSGLG